MDIDMQVLTAESKSGTAEFSNTAADPETKPVAALVSGTSAGVLFAPTMFWLLGSLDAECVEPWPWHSDRVGGFVSCAAGVTKVRRFTEKFKSLGFAIIVPALLLHMVDTGINSQILAAAALIFRFPDFHYCFWKRADQGNYLPSPYSFLLYQFPCSLQSPFIWFCVILQPIVWHGCFHFCVPVYSNGTLLQIPNGSLQVADACSGFFNVICDHNCGYTYGLFLSCGTSTGSGAAYCSSFRHWNIIRVLLLTLTFCALDRTGCIGDICT